MKNLSAKQLDKATSNGVKMKKRERREKTEEPAGESGMVTRKEALDGSLYVRKAIKWFVVYFDQRLGAAHAKRWLK